MNQGTVAATPAQQLQQKTALAQMQNYMKTQLPALGYAIRTTKENQPAQEEMAVGRAAQTGRVASNEAMKSLISQSPEGARPGSGAFAARAGGIMQRGAGVSGEAIPLARSGAREDFYGAEKSLVGSGNQMLSMGNQGLVTAGGVQAAGTQAAAQANAQRQQMAASAIMALALI